MPDAAASQIRSILENSLTVDNGEKATVTYIANHSTDMSYVFQYLVVTSTVRQSVFAKADKKGSGLTRTEYQNIIRIKKLDLAPSPYAVPKLVFYHEEKEVLALEECTGVLFLDYIEEHCKWLARGDGVDLESHAESIGRWLTYYEQNTKERASKSFRDPLVKEFNEYAAHFSRGGVHPRLAALFSKCQHHFFQELDNLEYPVSTYLSHGDFHPGNLFIDDQGVTAIDFQQSKRRLAGYDAMYFELNLRLSFGLRRFKVSAIKQIQGSFAKGYLGRKQHKAILKPLIGVRTLVYLSSITMPEGGLKSKLSIYLDTKKLESWLQN